MSEFKTYTLEQLCIVGSSKRVHLSDYVQQGIPFYRSKEVIEISSGKNISEQLFISSEKYSEIKSKFPVPQENDVLITAVGTIGEILVVKDPNFYFKDGNLIWLRNIDFDIIDIDYLYYFFKSDLFQKTIKYNNIGAVQKALTIDFLKTVKITLPSLDNQRKLVSVLKSIDKKIQTNNQIIQELETMAKTLYDYWFVQFDFPDQNGKPYRSSGGKMVYNPELKREIPEGWEVEKLSSLLEIGRETINPMKTPKEEFKYYSIPEYDVSGSFSYELGETIRSNKFIVEKSDLLVSKLNPWFNRVVYNLEENAISSTEFIVWKTFNRFEKNFLYQVATSKEFIEYCTRFATGTSNSHKRVSPDIMVGFQIPFKKTYIQKFGEITDSIRTQVLQNNVQNQELTQLRDWLLPMLMNGQVKVE